MWYSAFLLGLLGSLHCLGMCGPIALMLPVDRDNHLKSGLQTTLYHGSRIVAYGVLGLIFGFLGQGISLFGSQQKLSIAIGLLMIVLVLIPFNKMGGHRLTRNLYQSVSWLKSTLGASFQKKNPEAFLTIGFLNGLLPCGLVYMALLGATATGGPAGGVLFMLFFGLGTIPLMTFAIFFGRVIKTSLRDKIRRWVPVFVILIGLLFILRGMGLGIPYVSPQLNDHASHSSVECHSHEEME